MTGTPHAFFMVVDSELRRLQYMAEADRERLAQQAVGNGNRLRRWADVTAVLAFFALVIFALANLAGPVAPVPAGQQTGTLEQHTVTEVLDERLLDPGAAISARESLI